MVILFFINNELFEITENDFINCNNKNEKNNNNINLKLASLIRENKEYKKQINDMKKDNETLIEDVAN